MIAGESLTPTQERLVLSVCPRGSRVVRAEFFRREYLPCPLRVVVGLSGGGERTVVLRLARHGSVEEESRLLGILGRLGLPVPAVLAGPEKDPDLPGGPLVAVYSLLDGQNLQDLSQQAADGCRAAARLVVEGASRLASLTERLRAKPEAAFLRTVTLTDRLDAVVAQGGPWLEEPLFADAIERLRPALAEAREATVFTGGDYQPANFLTDGARVTGFVDFELAGYQDFLFGFAKYPIYDLHPLNKGGFIPYLLEEKRIARQDFEVRVALGCLVTLQREIPVAGGDSGYRAHVLGLLAQGLDHVEKQRE